MPKLIKTITTLGIDYSLLKTFKASSSASTTSPAFKYKERLNLKLWVDFAASSPTDRSKNGLPASDISSFVYEGSPETSTNTIGSKTYNFARFDDSENTNAKITYASTTNSLSFGGGSDSPFSISFWYYRESSTADASKENFLFNITEGTWTRYNESLAVAKIESDKKIKLRKKILNQKISNSKITRNKKTKLLQKRYYLNRASSRSFIFQNGNIIYHLNRNGKKIKLVFSKGGW